MSCVLGFDVGSKLIGVAVGNRVTVSARAIATIAMRDDAPDWAALDALRSEWLPDSFVVGLPLTLDGEEQAASKRARRFAERLRERYRMPVSMVDERHSSLEAAERFAHARAAGLKRRRDAVQLDAEAAAVILERWLHEAA
ncbi:Holliday junction resolvase RuvX [Dyella nitratireducens]|uniref:Putative pre-16S rRNA nuclease n=1 Tax=Dyella nitratireducens TaxID=1849580 RepID=A0ABQ1FZX3_9GAMM|nr:Holliday junction resolvase RuvX [Dyella nitratireducens]GGA34718.1 putative pre-16S rRNA nuclease [Dyella nitratireducens]GLQ40907.1 putative pre-16S rRNA nuclease [Dyella nitratireducens]